MAFSYSGVVNYGKATLPAVDSWNMNMNIIKDPPRSVQTRKIDKVGETMAITSAIDDSGDRFCEAINYYARGQNPMVAVSYGEGQRLSSGGSEAFLPYRVARDGAFRPPIWRQEDLLPLSRMPRIWTQMSTQPYNPIFTMRMRDCGTVEETKEVKNNLLKMACVANRTVAAYPDVNEPDVTPFVVHDPLVPGEIRAAASCGTNDAEFQQRQLQAPLLLAPTRDATSGYSNPNMIRELPVVMNNVHLQSNHPTASATTNFAAGSLSGYNPLSESSFNRLLPRTNRGGFNNYQAVPSSEMVHPTKNLVRVR